MRDSTISPASTAKPAAPTRAAAIKYHVANYAENPRAHAQLQAAARRMGTARSAMSKEGI
jgi:hypothetical protein